MTNGWICKATCMLFRNESTDGTIDPWWRHQMETFSALLAICAGNSPVPGEFPTQRPVTRSFDVYFDLRPNKRLSKQSWGWWFETQSRPLWRHRNALSQLIHHGVITWKRFYTPVWKTVLLCFGIDRPSVRPSEFFGLFSTWFEISIWNLVCTISKWHDTSSFKLSFIAIRSIWPIWGTNTPNSFSLHSRPYNQNKSFQFGT